MYDTAKNSEILTEITFEEIFERDTIIMSEFINICSDTLIGSFLLNEVIDNYIETGELFIEKEDFEKSNINLNLWFTKDIKLQILNEMNLKSRDNETEFNVIIPFSDDNEFESSKNYYFKKESGSWIFKGILIVG